MPSGEWEALRAPPCFLKSKKRTANPALQNYNGDVPITHQNIYEDRYAVALAFDALDNPGPAKP